jgi:hypothetical protein
VFLHAFLQEGIEYILLDTEYPPVIKYLDITTNDNMSDKSNFLSKEFGDFMNLITKWNLSDSCSNELLQFTKGISRKDVILPNSIKQGRT